MTTLRTLLAATTALAALAAIPAIGAVRGSDNFAPIMYDAADQDGSQATMLILASNDDDDDDDDDEGEDDDDDEDNAGHRSAKDVDCEDDDDVKGAGCSGAAIPAPAGPVAPPANGLFGTGAAPQVQVN